MATNKNATIRYQTLDRCFSNRGKRFFLDDLVAACNADLYEYSGNERGIGRRQLFEDIKFMMSDQGWSIPLERCKDGKRVYYRYSDPEFSINKQPLSPGEADQLKEVLLSLGRFKGMPQFQWLDEMIARLKSGFHLDPGASHIIEFEENPYLKGNEHITPLFNAIRQQQVLRLTYQGFKQAEPDRINFHPYYLKQYNNRWFAFGWNELAAGITNLALDRIQAVTHIRGKYRPNTTIDFTEYFEDVVGVTVPETSTEVVELLISPKLWPYIKTKPMHGSQKVVTEAVAGTTIRLDVKLNYELESLLLSFGEGVEVVKPSKLRSLLRERTTSMCSTYQDQV